MYWIVLLLIGISIFAYFIFKNYNVKEQASCKSENSTSCTSGDDVKPGDSWSLVDFARMHGKMKVSTAYNAMFKKDCLDKCMFTTSDGKETIACIANVVKTYTPKMIEENKDKLHIRVLESGHYCLCKDRVDVDLWNS